MNTIDTNALSELGLSRQETPKANDQLGQEDFLELMVTQLRNQDPFKPMESGEFLGQIAQFGTVSGIEDVRSALVSLTSAMTTNRTLQAANLVGRDALVSAGEAFLAPNGNVRGAIELPPGATTANVEIYDLTGQLVNTVPVKLTGHDAGTFEWNGEFADGTKAPSGYYEVRASGEVEGTVTAFGTLIAGSVESVSIGAAGGSVELTVTGLGVVDLADVRRVS